MALTYCPLIAPATKNLGHEQADKCLSKLIDRRINHGQLLINSSLVALENTILAVALAYVVNCTV